MDFLTGIVPLILIIGVFYFLMIMPQQKKAKKHQNMLKNLGKGDEIVTEGGIYGIIADVKKENKVVVLKIAKVKDEDVKIEVSLARVAFLVRNGELVEGTDS